MLSSPIPFSIHDSFTVGEMQKHYTHEVPPVKVKNDTVAASVKKQSSSWPNSQSALPDPDHRRIVLVFRSGASRVIKTDSGSLAATLQAPPVLTRDQIDPIGRIKGLFEGDPYARRQLRKKLHALSSAQGGVSGTKDHGASAIVVSKQDEALRALDTFDTLHYSATFGPQGGGALYTSFQKEAPIRVFRTSSLIDSPFRAQDTNELRDLMGKENSNSQIYRYDGLYKVRKCFKEVKNGSKLVKVKELDTQSTQKGVFTFELQRLPQGKYNVFDSDKLLQVSRMSGTMPPITSEPVRANRVVKSKKGSKRKKTTESGGSGRTPSRKKERRK
jgi:hypothetical protein